MDRRVEAFRMLAEAVGIREEMCGERTEDELLEDLVSVASFLMAHVERLLPDDDE